MNLNSYTWFDIVEIGKREIDEREVEEKMIISLVWLGKKLRRETIFLSTCAEKVRRNGN